MKETAPPSAKYSGVFFLLLCAALTVCILLGGQSLLELPQIIATANIAWLLAALGAILFYFAAQGVNIKWLFSSLGYPITFKAAFGYALVDFYFSAITPCASGGQPAQLYYMQKNKLPIGAASLVIMLFNMTYHIAAIGLIITAFCFKGTFLAQQLGLGGLLLIYGISVHLLLTLGFAAAIFKPDGLKRLLQSIYQRLSRFKRWQSSTALLKTVTEQLNEYSRSADYIKAHPFLLLRCQLVTIVHLLMLFSIPYFIYRGLNLDSFSYFDITALQSAFAIAVDTLPLPGGVGAAEGGFVLVYQQIFAQRILPAMLLFRTVTYYGPLLLGGVTAFWAQLGFKKQPYLS